jgi:hypothetical protein
LYSCCIGIVNLTFSQNPTPTVAQRGWFKFVGTGTCDTASQQQGGFGADPPCGVRR